LSRMLNNGTTLLQLGWEKRYTTNAEWANSIDAHFLQKNNRISTLPKLLPKQSVNCKTVETGSIANCQYGKSLLQPGSWRYS
jgi:hypothetical protein